MAAARYVIDKEVYELVCAFRGNALAPNLHGVREHTLAIAPEGAVELGHAVEGGPPGVSNGPGNLVAKILGAIPSGLPFGKCRFGAVEFRITDAHRLGTVDAREQHCGCLVGVELGIDVSVFLTAPDEFGQLPLHGLVELAQDLGDRARLAVLGCAAGLKSLAWQPAQLPASVAEA